MIKITQSQWTAIRLCFILFVEPINYLLHTLVRLAGINLGFTTEFIYGIFAACFLSLVFQNPQKFCRGLIFPLIILALYTFTAIWLGSNFHYVSDAIAEKLFMYCLPTYVALFVVDDYTGMDRVLPKYCGILLLSQLLTVILMSIGSRYFVNTDYQGISYVLLVPITYYVCKEHRNRLDWCLLTLSFAIMLFFGGRGPLLCAVICIAYKILIRQRCKNPILIVTVFVLALILIYNINSILSWVVEISQSYGFRGSILKYMERGDVFSDSGRGTIHAIARSIIADHPLMGIGLGGDRYYLGSYGFKYGNYPHSIFYEIIMHFGYPVGICIFIAVVAIIMKAYRKRNLNRQIFSLLEIFFMGSGFLVLFFSSSYLVSPFFFGLIALSWKLTHYRHDFDNICIKEENQWQRSEF